MTISRNTTTAVGRVLDEAPTSRFHYKAAIIAGMGFFTDAYDLLVVGAALLLIKPEWHLSAVQVGLIGGSALIASFLGALVFGRLGDLVGRKRIYGLEAVIMAVGAILTAVSPNFAWLLVARFLLGVGIGGDYPISATFMVEYSNRRHRGRQVALMFSAYALGNLTALAVALALLAARLDHDLVWRLMFGLGAVPALAVLRARRRLPESPRFTAAIAGDDDAAARDAGRAAPQLAGTIVQGSETPRPVVARGATGVRRLLTDARLRRTLLGTGGAWLVYDIGSYGNTISQPFIVDQVLAGHSSPTAVIAVQLMLVVIFTIPGVIVGIFLMDRIPRRAQQVLGLGVCGFSLIVIGAMPGLTTVLVPFLLCFGLSSFGSSMGPNPTTMALAAESFPTTVRSTAHGVSAAMGKLGAYLGALAFPLLLATLGLRWTELVCGLVFLSAIPLTLVLPEPAGRQLDDFVTLDAGPTAARTAAGPPRLDRPPEAGEQST